MVKDRPAGAEAQTVMNRGLAGRSTDSHSQSIFIHRGLFLPAGRGILELPAHQGGNPR